MLNRRYLRIKVLQEVYAYLQSGNDNIEEGVKALLNSIDKVYELFIYELSFLVETGRYADRRLEENKNKQLPTEQDLNPNMRYVNNRILARIDNNKEFRRLEEKLKINWGDETDMFHKFYNYLSDQTDFRDYMSSKTDSFKVDQKILLTIVSDYLVSFDFFRDYCEERNIYYSEDYYLVLCLIHKFISDMHETDTVVDTLPSIYRNEEGDEEDDRDFVKKLFRQTILNSESYSDIIGKCTSNWEQERIATMDMIIVKMGMAEFEHFRTIPVKVTINEYIELSKYFSTPKSKLFVNGILDRILKVMTEMDRVEKTGRGLIGD